MPVFTPGSMKSGLLLKYRSQTSRRVESSGGTTEEMDDAGDAFASILFMAKQIAKQHAVFVHGLGNHSRQTPVCYQLITRARSQGCQRPPLLL